MHDPQENDSQGAGSDGIESNTTPSRLATDTVPPPHTFGGILKRLGPGLIIAGSIVGSGELIATTATGAQAGIALLWLIIIGCLIKVFAQIELGRYTISHGETTLTALNRVPGPRFRANWIVWFWFVMMLCTVGQLGGIVGGVGQALAMTIPVSGDYLYAIRVPSEKELRNYLKWEADLKNGETELSQLPADKRERVLRGHQKLGERVERLGQRGELILAELRAGDLAAAEFQQQLGEYQEVTIQAPQVQVADPWTWDDKIWAAVVAIATACLLYFGRYNLIQNISTVLVVSFTFITIGNVISLQSTAEWHIPFSEFIRGMSFGPPEADVGKNPWLTALATFGIIGVGASELVAYPYWCLEKGYAKFTGPNTPDDAWVERARGWMNVMHYDAFASMIVYTIATIAFFVMGVAVLHKDGLDPDGMRMVSTLAEAYVPVFGEYAKWLFLSGAIAVLYSTFLVANAANARMVTDSFMVFGFLNRNDEGVRDRTVAAFSVILPLMCLAVFCSGANPVRLILIAGSMQAFMLPIIGGAALYFRYKLTDERLKPSALWDMMLLISFVGLLIAGIYGVYKQFS